MKSRQQLALEPKTRATMLRLSEGELRLLSEVAKMRGMKKAPLLRTLIAEEAERLRVRNIKRAEAR